MDTSPHPKNEFQKIKQAVRAVSIDAEGVKPNFTNSVGVGQVIHFES